MKEYEQLILLLQAKITELESIINSQARKIAELEKRLKKNSRNSSKPPSSDVCIKVYFSSVIDSGDPSLRSA